MICALFIFHSFVTLTMYSVLRSMNAAQQIMNDSTDK